MRVQQLLVTCKFILQHKCKYLCLFFCLFFVFLSIFMRCWNFSFFKYLLEIWYMGWWGIVFFTLSHRLFLYHWGFFVYFLSIVELALLWRKTQLHQYCFPHNHLRHSCINNWNFKDCLLEAAMSTLAFAFRMLWNEWDKDGIKFN